MAKVNLKQKVPPSLQASSKRLSIDKANRQTVIIVAAACFITVFALVAAHALYEQGMYLHKVSNKQQQALNQLNSDVSAANQLNTAYKAFNSTAQNVIGGDPLGTGDRDGDNAKIVEDALPPKYDFPEVAASVEKLLSSQNLTIESIGGTDEQLSEGNNSTSNNPQPVEMPFTFSVDNASYQTIQTLTKELDASIRPISIDTMVLSGGETNMEMQVTAHTYFQPGKTFHVGYQEVQ